MPLKHTHTMKQLQQKLDRIHQEAPKIASIEAEGYFVKTWRDQAWEGKPWKKRKVRDAGRGILTKSGRLRRGVRRKVIGKYKAGVENSVPYSPVHNEGLRVRGVQNVRAHTRRTPRGREQVRAHSRRVDYVMPQRRHMGNSKTLNLRIRKRLTVLYKKAI